MTKTPSTMLELGTVAPDFSLSDPWGKFYSLSDYEHGKYLGFLILFISNHCPFVKHVREALAQLGMDYQPRGIAIFAINANDIEKYPDDSPEKMKEEIATAGYTFPYLFDESQTIAKTYKAACTPDIYLFDDQKKLVYRGQLDDSRPGNNIPVTAQDLRDALDALLTGQVIPSQQKPSLGCNIKWKPGNEPDYYG